jgi:hypothetical protein
MEPQKWREQKIRDVDSLIRDGQSILDSAQIIDHPPLDQWGDDFVKVDTSWTEHVIDPRRFEAWRVKCMSLLNELIPKANSLYGMVEALKQAPANSQSLESLIGRLEGLRHCVLQGQLDPTSL